MKNLYSYELLKPTKGVTRRAVPPSSYTASYTVFGDSVTSNFSLDRTSLIVLPSSERRSVSLGSLRSTIFVSCPFTKLRDNYDVIKPCYDKIEAWWLVIYKI